MKLFLLPAAAICLSIATLQAAAPDGYYDSLNGKKGTSLRKEAKSIVAEHTSFSYSSGTWQCFLTTDTRIVDGQRCWWDMYSSNNVAAPSSSSHDGMNVEHAIANSWWGGTKNEAYKDLFNLNPSNSDANSRKGNYPFAEIATAKWTNGVTTVGSPKSGLGGGNSQCFEPLDEYKGDFARGLFYMFTVYDDINWQTNTAWMYDPNTEQLLKQWAIDMLIRWCEQDPVSQKELDRNEAIYKLQGNRNPYIDNPGLEKYVWGEYKDSAYTVGDNPGGDITPGGDDDDPNVDPQQPEIPDTNGRWMLCTSLSDLNSIDKYILAGYATISGTNTVAEYVMTTGSYVSGSSSGYIRSATQPLGVLTDGDNKYISSYPEDAVYVRLHPTGSSWSLEAYNAVTDNFVGYLQCDGVKWVHYVDAETSACLATVDCKDGEFTFTYGSNGRLCYNLSSPRFTTYTSSGTMLRALRLYRMHTPDVSTIIQNPSVDGGSTVEVYSLQGVKVAAGMREEVFSTLPSGLYIVVADGVASKICK